MKPAKITTDDVASVQEEVEHLRNAINKARMHRQRKHMGIIVRFAILVFLIAIIAHCPYVEGLSNHGDARTGYVLNPSDFIKLAVGL